MYGRLPVVDAFWITSLIKGDVRISVNMDRSNDEFVLMCSDETLQPKLIIQKIVLYFKKIQLTPSYRQAMFSEINRRPQEIFFKKLRIVKKHSVQVYMNYLARMSWELECSPQDYLLS